jgi:CheY-like chemotaxis protein
MEALKDPKILLVDDNRINQRLAKLTFSQIGLHCDIASNGKEAFEMYQLKAYDFIFMDIRMPILDGLESTKLIRTFEMDSKSLHRAKIIALSGSDLTESQNTCIESGMDDYVEKPIQVKWLSQYFPK